jgi:hypothetical protein
MMTRILPAAVSTLALCSVLSAQALQSAPSNSKDHAPQPGVLTGCVASPTAGTFTVEDEKQGRFQLTGKKLDVYIGKRVEVRTSGGGLHITTGLYPSPNVAAQAGAIDPVQAARAAMPGSPDYQANNGALPTVAVAKITRLPGACPTPSK